MGASSLQKTAGVLDAPCDPWARLEASGRRVLANRPVSRLIMEADRCIGVETADGELVLAREAVLSTIHVKHLVEMAPADAWGEEFLRSTSSAPTR